jgi:site-specific DNA-methyltransferase (adenine-specific)
MKINVSQLKHHPLNKNIYNLSDIDDLVENIKEVGLLQPLVLDQNNQVISGNRRLESIKRLKFKIVDVIRIKVKTDEIPLLLVSYNKQRIKSVQELLNEVKYLKKYYVNIQGKRIDLTSAKTGRSTTREKISKEIGISSGNLQKIIYIEKYDKKIINLIDKGILTINQAYLQVHRILKEKESISTTKKFKRDKFTNDDFKIYKKSSNSLKEIENEFIQTIFTSPPYWNKRIYKKGGGLGNERNPEKYVENLILHFKECYRVLRKNGSFFLNLGDSYLNGDLQNIPHQVILGLKKEGWTLRNTIIWHKSNPKPSSSKNNLTPSYEYIFHLIKNKNYFYNQILTKNSSKSKPSLPPRHRSINDKKVGPITPYIPREGKNIGDFWNEEIVKTAVANQKKDFGKEHPAPFPKEIVLLPILQTSKENDVILDPFCGTGTVGFVANSINRKFIGYDIN